MADITTGAPALISSDLVIEITPRWICQFRGTRAQLIAEGLISSDFKFPHRTEIQDWESGKFSYWMRRCRPEGMKGPQSVWANGDYWVVCQSLKGANCTTYQIQEKTRELAELVQGKPSDWYKTWSRAYDAKQDDRYIAFRTAMLGDMAPRKRGRAAKVKTAEQTQGASA
jgi:hypothetical protein